MVGDSGSKFLVALYSQQNLHNFHSQLHPMITIQMLQQKPPVSFLGVTIHSFYAQHIAKTIKHRKNALNHFNLSDQLKLPLFNRPQSLGLLKL